MLTEAETKEIEKEAKEWARKATQESGIYTFEDCYTTAATRMAEKKNAEIKHIVDRNNIEINRLKFIAKNRDTCEYCGLLGWTLEKWGVIVHKMNCPQREGEFHQSNPPKILKAQLEAAQESINQAAQVIEIKEIELGRLQAELSRVKEIAKQFAIALEYPNLTTQSATAKALTEFANLMNKEK